jgi:hypothetical protein
MPKATRVNSTPRRTASLRNTAAADPIFAAIDKHKELNKAWFDLAAALDEAGLRAVKQRDVDRAVDTAENAAWEMAQTKPSTAAGASALLSYIATGPVTGLFELGETHWHETAFRTVVASLAKITRQSQRAA